MSSNHLVMNPLDNCALFQPLKDEADLQGLSNQELLAFLMKTRMRRSEYQDRPTICTPSDFAEHFMSDMKILHQEHFVVLYLNSKNQVIHQQTIFIGSLNKSLVHPREVFREAIRRSAASLICLHNHPSGNSTPSAEDIATTKRLAECGKILGIPVLYHLIIGDEQYVSLLEEGYI